MSQTIECASPPVDGLALSPVQEADLAELLVLQRCCWVQEAIANDTLQIAALHETAADVASWAATWRVWCVRRWGRLVAAVRAHADGPTWEIGRLMVAPDLAGNGVGRWLLGYAEKQAPPGVTRFALSTGRSSDRNIALYQRAGYAIEPDQLATAESVQLTKPRSRTRSVDQPGGDQ